MAKDVKVNGVTYNAVPKVALPLASGSGSALFVDVGDTTALAGDVRSGKVFFGSDGAHQLGAYIWDWKGLDAELVETVCNESIALEDTDFAAWTPSTTVSTIVADARCAERQLDMVNYSYLMRWRFQFNAVYPAGTPMQAAVETQTMEFWHAIYRRAEGLTQISASDYATNACSLFFSAALGVFYDSNGARQCGYQTLGIYPNPIPASFSNQTADSPTVVIMSPRISARTNAMYFSAASAGAIDQNASVIKIRGDLYRMSPNSTLRQIYGSVVDLFNNPM